MRVPIGRRRPRFLLLLLTAIAAPALHSQVGIIFGGCFGRVIAKLMAALGWLDTTVPGAVGMYALLGAASFLGGLMRMSASMCLILMEMTGAPGTLPFLMMVLVIAKGVGDRFNYRCLRARRVAGGRGSLRLKSVHALLCPLSLHQRHSDTYINATSPSSPSTLPLHPLNIHYCAHMQHL